MNGITGVVGTGQRDREIGIPLEKQEDDLEKLDRDIGARARLAGAVARVDL